MEVWESLVKDGVSEVCTWHVAETEGCVHLDFNVANLGAIPRNTLFLESVLKNYGFLVSRAAVNQRQVRSVVYSTHAGYGSSIGCLQRELLKSQHYSRDGEIVLYYG